MKKIYFKNSKNWDGISLVSYNKDESQANELKLCSGKELSFDFDNESYDHIEIRASSNEKTGKAYTGALSIGVEYKTNEKMERELTYLFSPSKEITGTVENFVIEDSKNLTHRHDKSKKISVFLPTSYDGKTPHDILYFFDAQNLYCGAGEYTENGDPYGSWQLDVVLSELHRQYGKNIIVVGIDNADEYRSNELFMDHKVFGELSPLATSIPEDDFTVGYLDNLSEFMVKTLHPFVKERYCVDESNIGIGGSSMGGIASFYCALREMGFYKYVLSYSPAYGLYENSAFEHYFDKKDFLHNAEILPLIHIYCGGGDPLEQSLLPASKWMKTALVAHGYPQDKIYETYDLEKPHNEESWRLILCESFSKLFNL